MRWTIRGADRNTGKEVSITVHAADAETAESQASYNNILVESVQPAPPPDATSKSIPTPAEALDYATKHTPPASAHAEFPTSPQPFIAAPPPPRSRAGVSAIAMIFAAICYFAGAGMVIAAWSTLSYREPSRFLTDNAVGATANALEVMKLELSGIGRLIAGILFLIFARLLQMPAYGSPRQ